MAHQFIIRADQPFRGVSQSILLEDGTVAYTGGQSLEEYQAARGYPVKLVTPKELDQLMAKFAADMVTEPKAIREEDWWYALECLPPCRWQTVAGVELFHVSEHLYGDMVSWYAKRGAAYFTLVDQDSADLEALAAKVRTAAGVPT